MLTRPPTTNQQVLVVTAVAVLTLGAAQALQAAPVQQILGVAFLTAGCFLAAAARRPLAMLVFAGYSSFAIAATARALAGQLLPGLTWQQRVILGVSWLLLAWGAHQRAYVAWQVAHRGAP